ncbi:galactonate dehydratase [Streptomyces olivaceus]|uniref:galactonate dehydratase n=1 Tax=Streptomyces olivaceus TaxID=47716 RepID=UPI001CCAA6D6|nr:galactonate dehydratase [Streptomyces olivaceus]MBZ6176197.1 galactonate dehydratase [Streptomyces olivaceus]MBZ6182603.1 galactonate dehydratase [Streptomyces olivaceus]
MRIAGITAYSVPPRWALVRVTTDTGAAGWGEALLSKRRRAVLGAVADLADNLVGAPAGRIEELWHRMRRGAFFRGGPVLSTAAAAIEQALWDIKGRALGVPVHELFGGPVRERTRVYAWIGGDRPADVVAGARERVAQGFTAVKMNATAELDHIAGAAEVDAVVARVAGLREEFGTGLDVALDFHGRVHRSMVRPLLRELEQFRLMWVEEPLAPGHEDLLPEVARAAGATRIATGERLTSRWDFRTLLERGGVDILQPDVSVTGLSELARICHLAEAHDAAVVPHCPNGPVSLAASLQVAAACLNVPLHEQSLGLHYNTGHGGLPRGEMADYVRDPAPLTPVDGALAVPAGPGLGIEVDEAAVRAADTGWRHPDARWRHPDGRIAEW